MTRYGATPSRCTSVMGSDAGTAAWMELRRSPDDDLDGREITREDGCQVRAQLDSSDSCASRHKALRGLASSRTDLDHRRRARQCGRQLVEEVVGEAGAHLVVELSHLIEAA